MPNRAHTGLGLAQAPAQLGGQEGGRETDHHDCTQHCLVGLSIAHIHQFGKQQAGLGGKVALKAARVGMRNAPRAGASTLLHHNPAMFTRLHEGGDSIVWLRASCPRQALTPE